MKIEDCYFLYSNMLDLTIRYYHIAWFIIRILVTFHFISGGTIYKYSFETVAGGYDVCTDRELFLLKTEITGPNWVGLCRVLLLT